MARALLTNMRWRPSHLSINLPNMRKATWVEMKLMWKTILKWKPSQSYQTWSQTWHLPRTLNGKHCYPRIAWIWSLKTRNMSSGVSSSHNTVSQLMFMEWLPGHWDFQGLAKGALRSKEFWDLLESRIDCQLDWVTAICVLDWSLRDYWDCLCLLYLVDCLWSSHTLKQISSNLW